MTPYLVNSKNSWFIIFRFMYVCKFIFESSENEHHHHHCFAFLSMLSWVGWGLMMALLHNLRSWASSGLSFILLRSLLINWDHFFLGLPCSHLPSTTTCLQALAGLPAFILIKCTNHLSLFCVAPQCCLEFLVCPSIHLMICHSLSLHCTST